MIASLKAQFLDLIRLEFGFARGEHLLMSAILTPGPQQNKSKLLDQVRDVIRLKHYSIRTEQSYVDWIRRFILFHGKRHPRDMTEAEVSSFLTHLAREGGVAASTQNQALSGVVVSLQRGAQAGDRLARKRGAREETGTFASGAYTARGPQNFYAFARHTAVDGGAAVWERATVD